MKPDNFRVMFSLSFLGYYTEECKKKGFISFSLSYCNNKSQINNAAGFKPVFFIASAWGTSKNKDQICNDLGIKSLQKVSFGTMVNSY